MPIIHYNDPKDVDWIKTAKYMWGIPLNPRGEMSIEEYYNEAGDDLASLRIHQKSTLTHILILTSMSYLFVRTFIISSYALFKVQRAISIWLCLIGSILGIIILIQFLMFVFNAGVNCRIQIWSSSYIICVGQICNHIILLQKAYAVLCRQKWILIVGSILILPQLSYGFLVNFKGFITMEANGFCGMHYPAFVPFYWFSAVGSVNLLFSAIFCRVVYKQYRQFGSDAWRKLAHDGIQTMCMVTVCNIISCCLVVFDAGGNFADILFPFDW
jgi:hypothetical protein